MAVIAFLFLWVANDTALPPIPVTLEESLDTHYYEVTGLSPEHLIGSFRARPNPAVMATTRAGVSTRYDFAFGEGACHLMQVELALEIDITYPRWREEDRGSGEMRAEWSRFMTALEEHEQGHVALFREAAADLQERLSRLPPAPSCNALAQSVERERQRFDREVNVVQSVYEARTRNGEAQGARLRFR